MAKQLQTAKDFRGTAIAIASSLLTDWVGPDRAAEATGRIATALAACAASAKKPEDFYACTPQSVATCVAISALTGIMPSTGATALAYLIPQRPRKDAPIELNYRLSHRGLNALARRCSQMMIAVPIGYGDEIQVDEDMGVKCHGADIDNQPETFDELRGVVVIVKCTNTGTILHRGWVAKKVIEKRRATSTAFQFATKTAWAQDSDPWHKWPIEQAMKTAMHYAVSRGWCVIDDTEAVRALHAEAEHVVDAESWSEKPTSPKSRYVKESPRSIEDTTTADDPTDLLVEFSAACSVAETDEAKRKLLVEFGTRTTDVDLFEQMEDELQRQLNPTT